MDSRNFIQQAATLIKDIKDHALVSSFNTGLGNDNRAHDQLQKRVNTLFAGLQNPTLMTANKLADTALDAGFSVNPRILDGLDQAERCWGN
jgi:hypothetical protein